MRAYPWIKTKAGYRLWPQPWRRRNCYKLSIFSTRILRLASQSLPVNSMLTLYLLSVNPMAK
jgi:hypothetical protein